MLAGPTSALDQLFLRRLGVDRALPVPSLVFGASGPQALRALMALTFSPRLAASARLRCFSTGSFASASISAPVSSEVPTILSSERFAGNILTR